MYVVRAVLHTTRHSDLANVPRAFPVACVCVYPVQRWLNEDERRPRRAPETQLWVDKYRPRRYTDLISDEVCRRTAECRAPGLQRKGALATKYSSRGRATLDRHPGPCPRAQRVNREVLSWLKLWDACVFNQHTRQAKPGLDTVCILRRPLPLRWIGGPLIIDHPWVPGVLHGWRGCFRIHRRRILGVGPSTRYAGYCGPASLVHGRPCDARPSHTADARIPTRPDPPHQRPAGSWKDHSCPYYRQSGWLPCGGSQREVRFFRPRADRRASWSPGHGV